MGLDVVRGSTQSFDSGVSMLMVLWVATISVVILGVLGLALLSSLNHEIANLAERVHVTNQALLFMRESYERESEHIRTLIVQVLKVPKSN
jgi:hypothetical protein